MSDKLPLVVTWGDDDLLTREREDLRAIPEGQVSIVMIYSDGWRGGFRAQRDKLTGLEGDS